MQKTVRKKKRAKSCHAKTMQKPCQNHVMQTCKNHANMQKPCKNHAKTMQHAARTLASTLRKNVQAVRVMHKTSCSTCHEKTTRKTVRKNVQAVRVMQKTSCSTCHAKPCKNHAKTMQTCKNHATCGAYAGVYAGRRGTAAWRVRYSTYSTYSKDAGESGGSAAWLQCRAGAPRGFCARQVARNFVAILRQQESAMEQF